MFRQTSLLFIGLFNLFSYVSLIISFVLDLPLVSSLILFCLSHRTQDVAAPSYPLLDSHVAYLYFNPPRMASAKQEMIRDTISPSPSVCVRATAQAAPYDRCDFRSRVLESSGSRPQHQHPLLPSLPCVFALPLGLRTCFGHKASPRANQVDYLSTLHASI